MPSIRNVGILSDSELLKAEFRFSDPINTVDDLSRDRPDPSLSPDIVGFYDDTPLGGRLANPDHSFIWCCHCQKDTHWKGYIVEDGTNHRFTIGNKCGLDHYGAAFENVITSFNEKRARKAVLRDFHRLETKIENLEREISILLACPMLSAHECKHQEISKASPKGLKALQEAVGRGSLNGIIKTRNFAAEQEREERYEQALQRFQNLPSEERRELRDQGLRPELDDSPIIDSRSADFGHVIGTSLIGLCDPRKKALELKHTLQEFQNIVAKGTDLFASKQIASVRRKLFDTAKVLRKSLIDASFGETFFQAENLNRISAWSACYRGFLFKTDNLHLIVQQNSGQDVVIKPLQTSDIYMPPSLDTIHFTGIEDNLIREGVARMENPNDPSTKVFV
jgi:hypothetical protein